MSTYSKRLTQNTVKKAISKIYKEGTSLIEHVEGTTFIAQSDAIVNYKGYTIELRAGEVVDLEEVIKNKELK
jgi:hypothetical protein